jgi:hypothetical protein
MSDDTATEQRAYDHRLQRRLKILKEQLDAGSVEFMKGSQVIESLKRVRYAPDGSVDLSTVDASVRATALAMEFMHDRQELKDAASLADLQLEYFGFLDRQFGELFKTMRKRRATPHQVAMAFSRTPGAVRDTLKDLPRFVSAVEEFWRSAGPTAIAHVEDMHDSLKGVFGGDLFPTHSENIASKCGLYTDTIVLPDPFLRSKHIFERSDDQRKIYYAIKHGMNLLQYKELACAEVSPPVVVVLPDTSIIEDGERSLYYKLGAGDAVIHATKLFGRDFSSFDEVIEFCKALDTAERAALAIRDESRFLFGADTGGSFRERLAAFFSDPFVTELNGTTIPGLLIASQELGRMSTINELLGKASRLQGTPIIDAPRSWQYFVWKLEYDAERFRNAKGGKDLHIVRGLQALAENEMKWLGKIPSKALIEIRKTGALSEIRGILGSGIEELATAKPANFCRTSDRVFDNITAAFVEHQKDIDTLRAKKWKFAGKDIGSWLVVGSLAATAAATGVPVWGLAALAADQLLAAPKLRELPASARRLAKEGKDLQRSPVGMLFKLKGKSHE